MTGLKVKYEMRFGKFKGEELGDVPAWYLLWLYDQDYCPVEVKDYVDKERKHLEKEKKEQ